ncbi:glycosyltransferase family 39 protein [Gloeocapsa sp. PCC 73106]|uniref:glycosyltransferase family 39 protein n=1 Tax=Gloeocapsa sp. PCC 73106 TaxID=102232 RepID=UPI0002ACF52C|nr:glycosyltransferase family 39 protein [Gloeocapsa sp. PCC 73106]ELR99438.1 hypothetical protein GLO73106DRAFT_00032890 [Gloeocapsa sp. PCC 73106]
MSTQVNSHYSWLNINKNYPYLMITILLCAIIIRLIGLNKGLWIDEFFSLSWLVKTDNFFDLIIDLRNYNKPPFYFLLLYLWAKIDNSQEFLRLFSVIFDLGLIVVVMIWLKRYSPLASILAGLYFMSNPVLLRFSQEIRPYSLLFFATALTFYFTSQVTANPTRKSGYIGLTLSLTLAVSVHLVAIMLVASVAIFIFFMTMREKQRIALFKTSLALIIPCIIFLLFKYFYLTGLPEQKTNDWWMPSPSWSLISATWQYLFGFSSLYFSSYLDHVIAFIFSSILIISLIFGKWKQNISFLVAAVLFWLQIIIYSLVETPIFFYRIILPGLVPFIAFIVLQLDTIDRKTIKNISITLSMILFIIFTSKWIFFQAYRPVEYYKEVAQLIESQWKQDDLVLVYPGYISGTVKYHFEHNLKDKDQVILNLNNSQNSRLQINEINKENVETIFLVFRVDLSVKESDFVKILTLIKSEIKKSLNIKTFLIISHDLYFSKNSHNPDIFLKALELELGKPVFLENKKAYVLSDYQLNQS